MTTKITETDWLVILMEECAEVQKICAKMIRFGPDHNYENTGINRDKLAMEIGDILGVMDEIQLDMSLVRKFRATKRDRVEKNFKLHGRSLSTTPVDKIDELKLVYTEKRKPSEDKSVVKED